MTVDPDDYLGLIDEYRKEQRERGEGIRSTLGDVLDFVLDGPAHYVSDHCLAMLHQVCLIVYGGRTCECECHRGGEAGGA